MDTKYPVPYWHVFVYHRNVYQYKIRLQYCSTEKRKGPGYHLSDTFLHKYVSSPNYFGEIIEWVGWAVLTWSISGAVFLAWTIANLLPRAIANHRWYREKFKDYPKNRKALIPGLL